MNKEELLKIIQEAKTQAEIASQMAAKKLEELDRERKIHEEVDSEFKKSVT